MSDLLAPLAFGLLLFYALDPAVDALERVRVPRWFSAALVLGSDDGARSSEARMRSRVRR